MRISVPSIFRVQLQKFRGVREDSTRHPTHCEEISQNVNAQLDIATISMGNSASSEAPATSTLCDKERGGFLQTSILLLNVALPVAEIFTPVKVIVGFLLESAKLLDKRNANLIAIKTIASRADDLLEALSTYAPDEGATSGGQLEASGILDKISQTIIRRISVIISKIQDLEKRGNLQIEIVASALQDAKSELDHCVQFAQFQLSLYQGKTMQGLVLQMGSVYESCAITRRALKALQPSIQRPVAWKTFKFVDMTGRVHHVPCGVAFVEENFRLFLKEELFCGQDTLSIFHKSLLQNKEDNLYLHSSTKGYPVHEETMIYMKVKRKFRNVEFLPIYVRLWPKVTAAEVMTTAIHHMSRVKSPIPDPAIDDILTNPLIRRNHIVNAVSYKVYASIVAQLRMPGHPHFTYASLVVRISKTKRGNVVEIGDKTPNATGKGSKIRWKEMSDFSSDSPIH
ncbi:hypothetical protein BJ165DRAFT_1452477 [Panaeolus papilionaceus]|nr:hypothetical protein BJ165DRAFT_1452477 [Panaeolus papilionaceus]